MIPPKGSRMRAEAEFLVHWRRLTRAVWAEVEPPLTRFLEWVDRRLPL